MSGALRVPLVGSDCVYWLRCPLLGTASAPAPSRVEKESRKEVYNAFHPYKRRCRRRSSRGCVTAVCVCRPLARSGFGRAAAAPVRKHTHMWWQHFKWSQLHHRAGTADGTAIPNTPIFLFGVADKCSFLLKAKNTKMREQQNKLPLEQKLRKEQWTPSVSQM